VELLDLQQKEETLREAQYSNQQASAAREQVDETAAQSQIFFLFTVVTIIFVCGGICAGRRCGYILLIFQW
jgi:hypothetical protein